MIFKTFDSKIDKWTSKIGIFGKSFNELGTAVNNAFKSIIDNLDNFDEDVGFWESFKNNLFSKKEDIKSQLVNVMPEIEANNISDVTKEIKDMASSVSENKSTWQNWFDILPEGKKHLAQLGQQLEGQIITEENLVKANQQARASALAQNEAIKAQTFSAKAGTAILKALSIAGNMIAMWAITKGIELAVKGIDNLAHSAEHCSERVDELMSSYQSALDKANSNAKTVENLASRYEELSKGVNNLGQNVSLTTDEYSEYNDIVNQIADMFPTLVQGYTNEGNAILSLKGNVGQLRDAYKEAQQEAYNMLIISGEASDGNAIIKNWENLHETNFFSKLFDFGAADVGGQISMSDAMEQLKALSNMSAETYRNIERAVNWEGGDKLNALTDIEKSIGYGSYIYKALGIDEFVTDEAFEEARKKAKSLLQTYQAEIDSALKNVQTLANAYLNTSNDYAELDEQSKNAASIIVNSINENIANEFEDKVDVGTYVTGILTTIKDNPEVRDSLVGLFSLDINDMPIKEAKEIIDVYIASIADALHEGQAELKIRLGFDDIGDSSKRLQNSIRQIADDHGIVDRDEYSDLSDYTNDFTQAEVELWLEATLGAKNATQAIKLYESALADTKDSATSTPLSITETVDQINTQLKSAFDSLQSAYQDIFTLDEDTGEKLFSLDDVDISTFESIRFELEKLSELDGINVDYSQFEDFVSVLSNTSSTAEDVQEQFNKLATDIIYTSDCTNMSAETFDLLAKSLSEMGITNAYEMLGKIRDAQEELAELSYDAETATIEETKSLIELGLASVETEEYLRHYLIQKELAQNPLSTLEDILQLESLCNALGITSEMYEAVTALKASFESQENGNHSAGIEESIQYYQQRLKELASGYGYDYFKFGFEGASSSGTKSSSSSSVKDTIETFDWIEQAIENVEKEIEELDEIANSSYSTFSEKNEALAQEISKVSEEIDLQQQAYDEYMRKADSIILPDYYKQLVQSGAINIEDISDENLQDLISEYQNWYDKAQDVSDAIKQLKTDMKDLYVSSYELQTGNLKDRLDSDSITQKQYLDGLKEAYERFYADLEDFAEQYHEAVLDYLAEEKDYLNSVAGAAAAVIDTEIDKLQADAESQENSIQKQIDLLEAKKKPLQDELDALEDKANRENLIFRLQKAQYELARSENQRTKLLYKNGQMVYTSDPADIADAKKEVDDANLEIQKQSIRNRIDALDEEIERYNSLIDQINHTADTQIDALEKIKSKWLEVTDRQESVKNVTLLTSEFGTSAIAQILTGNDDDLLKRWKNNYISTLAGIDMESQGYISEMTGQIASLYDVDLSALQDQFQNVTASIGGVTDALGMAASSVGIGISTPANREDTDGEPVSNNSLTDSIANLGVISGQTLPNVTSNMEAIAENAANASFEVSNVADAIDHIPESKDVTISVHTVGIGNASGGTSSRVSQTAYIEGNAYASGVRHAEKGLAVVGEEKPEVIITNDKKAFLAKEPVLLNLEGGETVFDGNATAKMLKARGLRPVTAEESPLLKALSPYSPDEIRQRFTANPATPAKNTASSAIQNARHAIDNSVNNRTSCTINDVHINCPGITKDEVAKQIGTELTNVFGGMSLSAYQRANITR